jgi:hypothetical protein
MPVPDFQTMMLPFLDLLADGKPHTTQELSETLAKKLNVSEEERQERLPSGLQTRWANRLAWIGVHLKFAQLIQRPTRGQMQIAERGLDVLKQKPAKIDLRFLRKLPGYEEARSGGAHEKTTSPETADEQKGSPLEVLETSFADLRRALAVELLSVRNLTVLPATEQALHLAKSFITHFAMPVKAADDALHVAIAASHGMNYLLTWNCRHIANVTARPKLEALCLLENLRCPLICTPPELMGDANEN